MQWLKTDVVDQNLKKWSSFMEDKSLVPCDHYFHTFFAYAAFCRGLSSEGEKSLEKFFSLKVVGHIEFNKYALILLYSDFQSELKKTNFIIPVTKFLRDGIFSVDETTDTGNNWLTLRMVVHLRLYILFRDDRDFREFKKYLGISLQFFHEDGLFFDYPPLHKLNENRGQLAFPLTYSFKILSLLMEAYEVLIENSLVTALASSLEKTIESALPAHIAHILPSGEALYYGRSDNTLFGYANVLQVLHAVNESYGLQRSVKKFIEANFIYEKKMSMSASSCRVGFRDNYIFDSVYGVYFLAKTLQVPLKPRWKLPKVPVVKKTSSGFIIRKETKTVFISGSGCCFPSKGSYFNGFRYTGLTPMALFSSKQANLLLDFHREKLIFPFSSIYFLPTLNIGQMAIRPQLFKQIKCIENTDEVVITGRCTYDILITDGVDRKGFYRVLRRLLQGREWWARVLYQVVIEVLGVLLPLHRQVTFDFEKKICP